MTPWRLIITRTAAQGFTAIPTRVERDALRERVERYARGEPGVDVLKLHGQDALYRVRSGKWRAVLERDKRARTMTVLAIDDRKDAYR